MHSGCKWFRHGIILGFVIAIAVALSGAFAVGHAQNATAPYIVHVTVLVETNIRATPAINGSVVGKALEGDEFGVVAASEDCAWLQIVATDDPAQAAIGWVTGNAAYTELSIACLDIESIGEQPPAIFATPTQTPTPEATKVAETVTVNVRMAGIPVRSGPGSTYEAVRMTSAGEQMYAVGQVERCRWLQVRDESGTLGWISGNPVYTQLESDCSVLASLEPPTPTPIPVPRVTILIDTVNIRASASVQSRILGTVSADESYEILGQLNECSWLRVRIGEGETGWISGNEAYTTISQPCSTLPKIDPTPVPTPTATPRSVARGCATVTNELGFAVDIDIRGTGGLQEQFSLARNETATYCLPVGLYTATLTSQARSDRFSVPLFVQGGENFIIPLRLP